MCCIIGDLSNVLRYWMEKRRRMRMRRRAICNVTIIHLLYSRAGAGTRGRGEVLGQAGVVEA